MSLSVYVRCARAVVPIIGFWKIHNGLALEDKMYNCHSRVCGCGAFFYHCCKISCILVHCRICIYGSLTTDGSATQFEFAELKASMLRIYIQDAHCWVVVLVVDVDEGFFRLYFAIFLHFLFRILLEK